MFYAIFTPFIIFYVTLRHFQLNAHARQYNTLQPRRAVITVGAPITPFPL